ncbi:hypothetical protein EGJ54_23705 [Pandoraea apista]|nr:hypothetical protein EGJ54_23705 [Pandoraea apista]RRW98959.1 hypothetical protein EGJ56_22575 [Pandoraea apista]
MTFVKPGKVFCRLTLAERLDDLGLSLLRIQRDRLWTHEAASVLAVVLQPFTSDPTIYVHGQHVGSGFEGLDAHTDAIVVALQVDISVRQAKLALNFGNFLR